MKDQHKTRLNVTNNLRIIPGDSEDVEIGVNFMYFDTPVYWSLPRQFLGDKVKNTFYVTRISSMNSHTIVTVRGEKSCTNPSGIVFLFLRTFWILHCRFGPNIVDLSRLN